MGITKNYIRMAKMRMIPQDTDQRECDSGEITPS